MYTDAFKDKLRQARIDCGMTQEEVAEELHIKRVNLSNYETGRREPDLETLAQLANLYGVTTDWLLGIGKMKP